MTYEEIEKRIDNMYGKPSEVWNLINLYIKKSKEEKNTETLLYAYRYASNYSSFPNNIKYSDSAIAVSKTSKDIKHLANAYLNKGMICMKDYLYQEALDNILMANKYSNQHGDPYIINKTIYYIAQNKIYLGLYEEANKELKSCLNFFRSNITNKALGKDYTTYYIYSLVAYIDSNTRLGRQSQNEKFINEGISYLNKNSIKQYIPYFISLQGTDAYYSKDYKTAIKKITEALKLYNDQWTHITEVYYLGMSYWNTGKKSLAVKFMEEIDKSYNKSNNLDPQFRSTYEVLIKYNDSIGNISKQLQYINKLMKLDKSYEKNYKYLYPKLNKEYDTQKLIEEKAAIENRLQNQRTTLVVIIVLCIGGIAYMFVRFSKLKKVYKQRFDDIIANTNKQSEKDELSEIQPLLPKEILVAPKPVMVNEFYNKIPGLKPNFVENILNQLDKFEKEHQFLNPQVSQKSLSEQFGTNSTYFSKIINTYKGKKFNTYINDLRLDYIVELIKTDYKYVNMDVKELAQISGFMNAENFSDNFQRKFKIKPSYFIKMMKESIKTSAE